MTGTVRPSREDRLLRYLQPLQDHRTELVLAGAALFLYLLGVGWGWPYANDAIRIRGWAIDSISPLGALSELYDTFVEAAPNRFPAYPLFHYMLLAVFYAPYLLYLLISGQYSQPGSEYPFGFADAEETLRVLEVIAKLVSMGMAAGVVVATFRTGKVFWGYTAGVLAAVCTMLMYPMFYYARTGNVDVPVLFWTSLGMLVFACILEKGFTSKRAAWLGVFAALATATKDQGYGAFALMPLVLLVLLIREARQSGKPPDWRPPAAGLLACFVVYAIGSGLALNPYRYLEHLTWIREHVPFPAQPHFPATPAGYAQLVGQVLEHVAYAVGPLMLLAAAAGVWLVGRRAPMRLVLLVPALGHFLFVLAPIRMSLFRYILPIVLVVCLFAGRALAEGLKSTGWVRTSSAALTVLICGWLLLLGGDLTYQMWKDSRYAAADWLEVHVHAGDEVAHVVSASALPPMKPGVQYAFLGPEEQSVEAQLAARRPQIIIVMPTWTTPKGGQIPAGFPEEAHLKLIDGSLGYHLAAYFKSRALVKRQILDYPTVNPPIQIFARNDP